MPRSALIAVLAIACGARSTQTGRAAAGARSESTGEVAANQPSGATLPTSGDAAATLPQDPEQFTSGDAGAAVTHEPEQPTSGDAAATLLQEPEQPTSGDAGAAVTQVPDPPSVGPHWLDAGMATCTPQDASVVPVERQSHDPAEGGLIAALPFSCEPYIPQGSGADGETCWKKCSTPQGCFFKTWDFYTYSGAGLSGERCVDDCLAMYNHVRSHGTDDCVALVEERDRLYLEEGCGQGTLDAAERVNQGLSEVCRARADDADGSAVHDRCLEHCEFAFELGREFEVEGCTKSCVDINSRYWMLSGTACFDDMMDSQLCWLTTSQDEAPELCADNYAVLCVQGVR